MFDSQPSLHEDDEDEGTVRVTRVRAALEAVECGQFDNFLPDDLALELQSFVNYIVESGHGRVGLTVADIDEKARREINELCGQSAPERKTKGLEPPADSAMLFGTLGIAHDLFDTLDFVGFFKSSGFQVLAFVVIAYLSRCWVDNIKTTKSGVATVVAGVAASHFLSRIATRNDLQLVEAGVSESKGTLHRTMTSALMLTDRIVSPELIASVRGYTVRHFMAALGLLHRSAEHFTAHIDILDTLSLRMTLNRFSGTTRNTVVRTVVRGSLLAHFLYTSYPFGEGCELDHLGRMPLVLASTFRADNATTFNRMVWPAMAGSGLRTLFWRVVVPAVVERVLARASPALRRSWASLPVAHFVSAAIHHWTGEPPLTLQPDPVSTYGQCVLPGSETQVLSFRSTHWAYLLTGGDRENLSALQAAEAAVDGLVTMAIFTLVPAEL